MSKRKLMMECASVEQSVGFLLLYIFFRTFKVVTEYVSQTGKSPKIENGS